MHVVVLRLLCSLVQPCTAARTNMLFFSSVYDARGRRAKGENAGRTEAVITNIVLYILSFLLPPSLPAKGENAGGIDAVDRH